MAFPWVSPANCWKKNEVYLRKAEAGSPPAMDAGYAGKLGSSRNRKPARLVGKNQPNLCGFFAGFLPLVVGYLQCWNVKTPPG